MNAEATLFQALHDDPADETAWLALADALEEGGQPDRAELLRLALALRRPARRGRQAQERRLQELLAAGVEPCVPTLTNSVGMRLALVPPGAFVMGSPTREKGRYGNEGPRHPVTLTRAFYLGVYPVTQREYQEVVGRNPSGFSATGTDADKVAGLDTTPFPVENVTWKQAEAFCKKLSGRPEEKGAGRVYRLPTEAEWEYACRAGTSTPFVFGSSLSSAQANFNGASPYGGAPAGPILGRPTPVGSYRPNPWGLYDLHGNVKEWVADWFSEDYYGRSAKSDPTGPKSGSEKAIRGGAYFNAGEWVRSADRSLYSPTGRLNFVGFRVACTVGPARLQR